MNYLVIEFKGSLGPTKENKQSYSSNDHLHFKLNIKYDSYTIL